MKYLLLIPLIRMPDQKFFGIALLWIVSIAWANRRKSPYDSGSSSGSDSGGGDSCGSSFSSSCASGDGSCGGRDGGGGD